MAPKKPESNEKIPGSPIMVKGNILLNKHASPNKKKLADYGQAVIVYMLKLSMVAFC
jgi:hypothetical protein